MHAGALVWAAATPEQAQPITWTSLVPGRKGKKVAKEIRFPYLILDLVKSGIRARGLINKPTDEGAKLLACPLITRNAI